LVPAAGVGIPPGLYPPATVQWGPDLIEAYVEIGSPAEAEAALAVFETQAQRTGRMWALATAARCRGLLASERGFVAEFEKALALHDRTPTPFERARTELSYGQRLRRAGLRRKSRDLLHAAYATFERLGAEPWTRRTATELRATGERVRPIKGSAAEHLTAQELQVALIVAEGATNREAAAQLFLSPKTIEFHLSHIFRKLGLRSRTELARRFAKGSAGTVLTYLFGLEWTNVIREIAGEMFCLAM
jgi:DNA-binding CsgD family transcriptional regulator